MAKRLNISPDYTRMYFAYDSTIKISSYHLDPEEVVQLVEQYTHDHWFEGSTLTGEK
jgi:hypothetical protein